MTSRAVSRSPVRSILRFVVLLLSALAAATSALAVDPPLDCALVDIGALGPERIARLSTALPLSVELDARLFACAGDLETVRAAADAVDRRLVAGWRDVDLADLFVVRYAHPAPRPTSPASPAIRALAGAAGYEIVRAADAASRDALAAGRLPEPDGPVDPHCRPPTVWPLTSVVAEGASLVAVRQTANRRSTTVDGRLVGGTVFAPGVAERVAAVDSTRWLGDVETLADWNRHSQGTQIDLARDWILDRFEALGLDASTESFQIGGGGTTVENVFGLQPGSAVGVDGPLIVVGGHYDSTSQSPSTAAPGAEDNASGCAGVLELARVMAPVATDASILYVCYAGEEQGLWGSRDHASDLVAAGEDDRIVLMLNMDMIGYSGDADLDVLLETENEWPDLPTLFEDAAAEFTDLRTVVSFFAFGSDHVPYLDRGMPALLTIENDWDSYPGYHRTSDLPENVVEAMGRGVLRMNAAVLAETAGLVDAGLVFADGFESGDTTSWSAP